jgi:hypothetical protein
MLFDLRGRGRRRTVQVIYLSLAILMGGGLVLFGIGGDVQGGLFDAFSQGQGDAAKQTQEQVDKLKKQAQTDPNNPRVYARLAETEYQLAGQSEGYKQETGEFTGEARKHLEAAKRAWEKHLQLAGDKPNAEVASIMRTALPSLGDVAGAVRAQEIVIDSLGDEAGFGDYANLAVLAYQAGQTRKGDLAAERAVKLAPKDQREQLQAQLESAKTQAVGGTGADGATTTP